MLDPAANHCRKKVVESRKQTREAISVRSVLLPVAAWGLESIVEFSFLGLKKTSRQTLFSNLIMMLVSYCIWDVQLLRIGFFHIF